MTPDVARTLAPLENAVRAAQAALDASNADPAAHPLDALAAAGKVIAAHQAHTARLTDLLDAVGPHDVGQQERITMQMHGRVRALAGD